MQKFFFITAGFSGTLAVILGAFGAHYLKTKLSLEQLTIFETGVRYQFYHTLAIICVGLLIHQFDSYKIILSYAGYSFIGGILLFSGSLYLLSTKNILGIEHWNWLGPVTPIGGALYITGWVLLGIAFIKFK